jgi:hypothetical protein
MNAPSEPDDVDYVEIHHDDTTWRFDRSFLGSHWNCIWGRGCQGILASPAEHLAQGCCSVGAGLDGIDEARNLAALAATLPAELFQYADEAAIGGLFADAEYRNTRVVDGACILLNRPGFAGGAGCALHLGALAAGESPIDWKPSVCWQLPLHLEWAQTDHGEVATLTRWRREHWGDEEMAWWCTEAPEAYTASAPVVESMENELTAMVGETVYVELRRRLR